MTNRRAAENRAAARFEREKHLVELLMQRRGRPVHDYRDPNAHAGRETGVDVLMVCGVRRIGIQVTEINTGHVQGRARAAEKKAWRDSGLATYGAWAQNDRDELIASIQRAITCKVNIAEGHSFDEFDDVWLLVSAGVPEMGAVASTLIMSPRLDAAALDAATLDCLARSKYERAYLHCVLDVERALYSWQRGGGWMRGGGWIKGSSTRASVDEASVLLGYPEADAVVGRNLKLWSSRPSRKIRSSVITDSAIEEQLGPLHHGTTANDSAYLYRSWRTNFARVAQLEEARP